MLNKNIEWRVLWFVTKGRAFCSCVTTGGGFCGCVTTGGVFCGCVMTGGGFDYVGGALSSLLHFLGFLDASILKQFKNNYKL